MVNSRMKPMITTDLLALIKENQSQTEQVSFYYKDTIKVVIKSKADVSAGALFSAEEQIVYITE